MVTLRMCVIPVSSAPSTCCCYPHSLWTVGRDGGLPACVMLLHNTQAQGLSVAGPSAETLSTLPWVIPSQLATAAAQLPARSPGALGCPQDSPKLFPPQDSGPPSSWAPPGPASPDQSPIVWDFQGPPRSVSRTLGLWTRCLGVKTQRAP